MSYQKTQDSAPESDDSSDIGNSAKVAAKTALVRHAHSENNGDSQRTSLTSVVQTIARNCSHVRAANFFWP